MIKESFKTLPDPRSYVTVYAIASIYYSKIDNKLHIARFVNTLSKALFKCVNPKKND